MFINEEVKAAVEAILFAVGESVEYNLLAEWLQMPLQEVKECIADLKKDYDENDKRGIMLLLEKNSCRLGTKPQFTKLLMQVQKIPVKRLSMAALEVLAIVAYRQPVTRPQIDEIRGVKSEKLVSQLIEKNLICECGHLDVPGKPLLYATTAIFLEQFSLSSIEELPVINE